jgi:hypothetical protein
MNRKIKRINEKVEISKTILRMLKTVLKLRELFLPLLKPVFPKAATPELIKSVNHSLLTIPFIRTGYDFRHFEYLQYTHLTPSCQLSANFLTPSSKFLEFDLFLFGGGETRETSNLPTAGWCQT